MPIPAAYAEPRADGRPNPKNFPDWMPYTPPFNLTKNPAASMPCGFADGLPVGLQVVGPLYGDLAVLQACRAYEAATARRLARRRLGSTPRRDRRRSGCGLRQSAGRPCPAGGRSAVASATSVAYSLSPRAKGGGDGKQGAETLEPGSQKAQAEKERRRQGLGRQADGKALNVDATPSRPRPIWPASTGPAFHTPAAATSRPRPASIIASASPGSVEHQPVKRAHRGDDLAVATEQRIADLDHAQVGPRAGAAG